MCGIFGVISRDAFEQSTIDCVKTLFIDSASRGKEASGLVAVYEDQIEIIRKTLPSSTLIKTPEYNAVMNQLCASQGTKIVFGHSRLATSGAFGVGTNNQPITVGDVVGIHNGVVANYSELKESWPYSPLVTDNDSEVVFGLINAKLNEGVGIGNTVKFMLEKVCGSVSIICFLPKLNSLLLASNHGSLFFTELECGGKIVFASELGILTESAKKISLSDNYLPPIKQVKPNSAYLINVETLIVTPILNETKTKDFPPSKKLYYSVYDNILSEVQNRDKMRRCTKCILPETMPFISFDDEGVCNFCQSYKRPDLKSEAELEFELSKYRKNDGTPDCILGLSGGRDSSYALHMLVKEMGMKPLAYTYDWGMVNSLARRNTARMIGELGIEHIIIAAPIQKKLRNIRRNINAWMHRPKLGLVPLFMAGDKHFFRYLNKLKQSTGISMRVWAFNRYEHVFFKAGFAGVNIDDQLKQSTFSPLTSKLTLAKYYGLEFLKNPAYLNQSLFDSGYAFLSQYFSEQNYFYIFDYLDWNEEKIEDTLINGYDWEVAPDTPSTWRIGDGTAPLYNFIYYTVAGFTENDAFRSSQVRDNIMTRDEALKRVAIENIPRFDSLLKYCTIVGIDFNDLVRTVESMPKLYANR